MKRVLLVVLLAVTASVFCRAEGEAAREQTIEDQINAAALWRDPFWPVGWQPPNFGIDPSKLRARSNEIMWERAARMLKISGISRTREGGYLAVVKGVGIVEAGDVISVRFNGLRYRWRVEEVTQDSIVPIRIGTKPLGK